MLCFNIIKIYKIARIDKKEKQIRIEKQNKEINKQQNLRC